MSSLQEIKNRLSSVSATKKITKAVNLVATSKLKKAKDFLEKVNVYQNEIQKTFSNLIFNLPKNKKNLFSLKKEEKNLYIVISSDTGLCGSYNHNILKFTNNILKKEDILILIGSKAINFFSNKGRKILASFDHLPEGLNYEVANKITSYIMSKLNTKSVSSVNLIFTEKINSISFEPKIMPIYPIKNIKEISKTSKLMEYEPEISEIVKNSFSLYCSSLIFKAIAVSKVAELFSRKISMENSADNADDLIEELELEYNRIRQRKITQGISEIISGSAN